MHCDTPTKLDLWTFAKTIGLNPLHFAGIDIKDIEGQWCQRPWTQYDWQDGDRVGREAVGRAISAAETNMEEALGYRLLPAYEVNERRPTVFPYRPENVNYTGRRTGGFLNGVRLRWGWIIEGGCRQAEQVTIVPQPYPSGDAIVWAADRYWMKGTVVAQVPAGTDPQEVRIFYPGKNADPTWEIRPADVSVSGTTATITFKRECAVLEDIWDSLIVEDADGLDDGDFLTTVEVFRVFTDPSCAASFVYQPLDICNDCAGGDQCPACALATQTACMYVDGDPKLGRVALRPATWDPIAKVFTPQDFLRFRQGDAVDVNYLAGFQDQALKFPKREMGKLWADAVAYYATSLLERPPCDCSPDAWEYWREDLSTTNPGATAMGGQITNVAPEDLKNPFGTRRGAIFAWKRVAFSGEALGQSILIR